MIGAPLVGQAESSSGDERKDLEIDRVGGGDSSPPALLQADDWVIETPSVWCGARGIGHRPGDTSMATLAKLRSS
jgi:hypothetical protein